MKTTEQHFRDTLPVDIFELAIKNTKKENLTDEFARFESCLICAFEWQKTSEGWDFWKDVYTEYPQKTNL